MKVYDLVKQILEKNPQARENDEFLYIEVLKFKGLAKIKDDGLFGLEIRVRIDSWSSLPKFESISRARRKLQELYPELRGKTYKKGQKLEKEQSKGTFIFREGI